MQKRICDIRMNTKKTTSTHPLNETPEGVEGGRKRITKKKEKEKGNISMLFYNYMRRKNERDEYVT